MESGSSAVFIELIMRILIPFICATLFALGGYGKIPFLFIKGWNAKLWRWLMGGFVGLLLWHGVITFGLLLLTYWLATSVFGYGDKSILTKFLSQNMTHFASGVFYGLASFPLLGWWAILMALISGIAFYLVEKFKISNPYAELLRGGVGSCLI